MKNSNDKKILVLLFFCNMSFFVLFPISSFLPENCKIIKLRENN